MTSPSHPDLNSYYAHTRFDYRILWNNRKTRAVHFGYYDGAARRHHAALENMNREMARRAGVQSGDRVLDAGCGWGSACFWLAEQQQAEVTGISLVASQIEDCSRFTAKHGIRNVAFLQADYCQTPFPDAVFDVVWACESLCHAKRKIDFYREAFRVLRPGGRLILAEYMRTARPLEGGREALLSSWLHPWAIPDLDTAEEHRANALMAGFKQIEIEDVTAHVRVSLRNLHDLSRKWLPVGRLLHYFSLIHDVRLRNAEASVRQYEALLEGAWRYGMGVARK